MSIQMDASRAGYRRLIDQFTGDHAVLDPAHPWPVVYQGIEYPTAWHAFHGGKTNQHPYRRWVADAPTVAEAKRRGQFVPLAWIAPRWRNVERTALMSRVNRLKLHSVNYRPLLATGKAILVYGNMEHDQDWGDCHCDQVGCRPDGDNLLGRILMRLRDRAARQQ
jgi:predicted NAD-dependent protein-ADP-ribosyltransferase YbiA (DUF1768 family)